MGIIAVLWGVALLAAIATSLLSVGNVSYRLALNATDRSRADQIADAAINLGILGLLDPRPDQRWRLDGIGRSISFDGIPMRVSIQDELGRIDLNYAEGSLLAGLFRSVGLDALAANGVVDKILDWRDPNSAKRTNGPKQKDYRALGYSYRPRNGPFQSVDELKLVMGMTPALFSLVEPALTVYSGRPLFDPQVAPREALLALPAMNPEKATALISARSGIQPDVDLPVAATAPRSAPGRAFTVRAETDKASAVLVREAAVRLTGDTARPYWVLSWRSKS
jgi:general secretion pathway protein K